MVIALSCQNRCIARPNKLARIPVMFDWIYADFFRTIYHYTLVYTLMSTTTDDNQCVMA